MTLPNRPNKKKAVFDAYLTLREVYGSPPHQQLTKPGHEGPCTTQIWGVAHSIDEAVFLAMLILEQQKLHENCPAEQRNSDGY